MSSRIGVLAVLLAAGVPGVLFAPVFGLWAVVAPIAVVLGACLLADELSRRVAALGSWRPLLALLIGLLGLAETQAWHTTAGGLPTGATIRTLVAGVTRSWQLTLQSTWPARSDAELILFVPMAVLIAAVLGVELLRRPLVALLPSLALLGLSQAYVALTGVGAIIAALGYGAVAAAVLTGSTQRAGIRIASALLILPILVLGAGGAIVAVTADPVRTPAYSLRHNAFVPIPPTRLSNPLDEVAARLRQPDTPVFSYRANGPVDRWRLVVLTSFNGVSWAPEPHYLQMGATVDPGPAITRPTDERSAQVTVLEPDLPWVPSQPLPASVSGLAPLINPDSGVLLAPDRTGPVRYELSWREPRADALDHAAIDSRATAGFAGLGQVPPDLGNLAAEAVGHVSPSFQAALALERHLSQHYRHLTTGTDLPTGSGWPQLRSFLLETKQGTSEQFAAAYVVLARQLGIPARLVVGFRAPPASDGEVVVRNENVLVWPEVAVTGVGWVPLDPTGQATGSGASAGGLAAVTAKARASLPPQPDLRDPRLPPDDKDSGGAGSGGWSLALPVVPILVGLLGLVVLALAAALLFRVARTRRRRGLTGVQGVVAAWWEARDRLRANGIAFTPGMTVRDLAAVAAPAVDQSVVDGLHTLARLVDSALWSGMATSEYATDEAWAAVEVINTGLADRPLAHRVRAAFDPPSLFPPRATMPTG